jgi:hypothetical protein
LDSLYVPLSPEQAAYHASDVLNVINEFQESITCISDNDVAVELDDPAFQECAITFLTYRLHQIRLGDRLCLPALLLLCDARAG